MSEPRPSLAERDPRLARLAEVSLRLQAGAVDDSLRGELASTVRSASSYPWQEVVERVLAEPVDPSDLFNRGLELQREAILGGGEQSAAPRTPVAPAAASQTEVPRAPGAGAKAPVSRSQAEEARAPRRRKKAPKWKVFLAILIVKGIFYGVGAVLFVWVLALARERFPEVDIYARYADLKDFLGGLFGR